MILKELYQGYDTRNGDKSCEYRRYHSISDILECEPEEREQECGYEFFLRIDLILFENVHA